MLVEGEDENDQDKEDADDQFGHRLHSASFNFI